MGIAGPVGSGNRPGLTEQARLRVNQWWTNDIYTRKTPSF